MSVPVTIIECHGYKLGLVRLKSRVRALGTLCEKEVGTPMAEGRNVGSKTYQDPGTIPSVVKSPGSKREVSRVVGSLDPL